MAVFSLLTNKSYQGNMKKVIQNIERMYNLFYYKVYGKDRQHEKERIRRMWYDTWEPCFPMQSSAFWWSIV